MSQERFCQSIGIDLVQAAKNELEFLRQVDEYPNLYKGPVLKNTIRRYEVFWLPLAAREGYGGRFLAAPLDISWVWHAHMLAPYNYGEDCIRTVSTVVDHVPPGGLQRKDGLEKAKCLWEREYPEEPFEIDLNKPPIALMAYHNSSIPYDLEKACYRQSKFYYQVSLPHYRDDRFLEKAVEGYEHHLQLTKQNPRVFVVPRYDYDLIWHVHQLHPVNYRRTTTQFFGRLLHHDDTATSRSPGSKLHDSELETKALWKAAGLQFVKPGAMYRGNPPDAVPPTPMRVYASLARCEYAVDILQVETFNMSTKTFLIQLEDTKEEEILSHNFQGNRAVKSLKARRFIVDNEKNHTITARIYERKLLLQKRLIAHTNVSVLPFLDAASVTEASTVSAIVFFHDDEDQYTAQLTMRINPPTIHEYNFKVKIGKFHAHDHPSKLLSDPQLMLPPSNLAKAFLSCSAVSQSVLDWREREAFKYRIVHSSVGMISAVEIINLDKQVVASAHTVNQNSLPQANAVQDEKRCVTLNQAEGERAMLIRGGQKDWGICIGKWQQEIRPLQVIANKCRFGQRFVSIRLFKLFGKQGWCLVRKSKFGIFVIKVDSNTVMRVKLKKSKVYISPHAQAIPEVLALALSVAVLHLLCMPYIPRERMESSHDDQISRRDPIISPMICAAGFFCRIVPTNVYIKHVLGEDVCAPCGGTQGLANYDFNDDLVCEWNEGPECGDYDNDGLGDTYAEENDDHEGSIESSSLEGDTDGHDGMAAGCGSGGGSVSGASGGCGGGIGYR